MNFKVFLGTMLLSSIFVLQGCISEDYDGCPAYITLDMDLDKVDESIYDRDYYSVFVFDEAGYYVTRLDEKIEKGTTQYRVNIPDDGTYQFVLWSGLYSNDYEIPQHLTNQTSIDEVEVAFSDADDVIDKRPGELYYSKTTKKIKKFKDDVVKFPIEQYTTDLTVTISGLDDTTDYALTIEDSGNACKFDKTKVGSDVITFIPEEKTKSSNSLTDEFTLLKFDGNNSQPKLKLCHSKSLCYEANLIDLLNNAGIDPATSHDLNLDIVFDTALIPVSIQVSK